MSNKFRNSVKEKYLRGANKFIVLWIMRKAIFPKKLFLKIQFDASRTILSRFLHDFYAMRLSAKNFEYEFDSTNAINTGLSENSIMN